MLSMGSHPLFRLGHFQQLFVCLPDISYHKSAINPMKKNTFSYGFQAVSKQFLAYVSHEFIIPRRPGVAFWSISLGKLPLATHRASCSLPDGEFKGSDIWWFFARPTPLKL